MSTINFSLRGRTVQPKIVSAVVERLRSAVPGYNDQNCFESNQPVPAAFSGGRECCTVSIGAGSFPHEFFAGAGSATLVEDGSQREIADEAVKARNYRQDLAVTRPRYFNLTSSLCHSILLDARFSHVGGNIPIAGWRDQHLKL